jgi:hypothetical protein
MRRAECEVRVTETAALRAMRNDIHADDYSRACPRCFDLSPGDYDRCKSCGVLLILRPEREAEL